MSTIILISCVGKKLQQKTETQNLYISTLFKKSLKYAKSLKPDKIYVLSAEYGLLDLNQKIEPYDKTLNKMSSNEIRKWANSVLDQLQKVASLDKDNFIILAGNNYRKFLLPHIKNYKVPLLGLTIGKQFKWLNDNTKHE
jgi:cytoplasmic iron level regulating protein YaaA (DUF328/UPF0246 family)